MPQTTTSLKLLNLPSKDLLVAEFKGKSLTELMTPAFTLDRAIFARNCTSMHEKTQKWGATFRAHLKTHKTAEGARLQLEGKADAIVVSTILEAWQVVNTGLVADGTVKDILYGLPIGPNKIVDVSELQSKIAEFGAIIRLLVDHPDQVSTLEQFACQQDEKQRWSVFLKIDGGQKRAGVATSSVEFQILLKRILESPTVVLYGFYSHAGDSYGSTSSEEASRFLSAEVEAVNEAAHSALSVLAMSPELGVKYQEPFVLSVGATPTAHAASAETRTRLAETLYGKLELHAGNYPILDLQQLHTGLIKADSIAHRMLATVVSYYPGRGVDGEDEALCDAGAIAMSKDTGPSGGFGEVIGRPWRLGRISQEHGILTKSLSNLTANAKSGESFKSAGDGSESLKIGEQIHIIGQHACLIASAHPWYYIVDSSAGDPNVVVDVWVPWKGW